VDLAIGERNLKARKRESKKIYKRIKQKSEEKQIQK